MTKDEFWFEVPLLIRIMVRMGYVCAYLYALFCGITVVVMKANPAEMTAKIKAFERFPALFAIVFLIYIFLTFAFGVSGYFIQKKKSIVAAVIVFCMSLASLSYGLAIFWFASVVALIGMLGTIWFNKEFSH
jgi:hypothetical protein